MRRRHLCRAVGQFEHRRRVGLQTSREGESHAEVFAVGLSFAFPQAMSAT